MTEDLFFKKIDEMFNQLEKYYIAQETDEITDSRDGKKQIVILKQLYAEPTVEKMKGKITPF